MAKPMSRVSRVVVRGPLAPFAAAYALELKSRGYTERSAVNQQRQVAHLSCWLQREGLSVAELDPRRVDQFLDRRREQRRSRSQSRPGLACLLDVLRDRGVLADEQVSAEASPEEALLESFRRYLLNERGLVTGTVRGYVDGASWFLASLPGASGLGSLTAADVTSAVLRRSEVVSVSTAQNFVASIKSFLRFCFVEGLVDADLSESALAVTGRRRSSLPRGISETDAEALLGSCDRRTGIGRRDYALILTLLRLGLRRSEVAALRLDDIGWRAGEVVVAHGKGSRQDRLPLPADVGAAIASYLKRGRPVTDRREVFLRARAPYEPIASGTVASTVRRACRRAGIEEVGSHRLRHTMACDMVEAGVPLVEIAQVLRHHSLQSTAVYARVDLERLRLLASSWPGSAQQ